MSLLWDILEQLFQEMNYLFCIGYVQLNGMLFISSCPLLLGLEFSKMANRLIQNLNPHPTKKSLSIAFKLRIY